jgi:hypothetical protein
MSTRLPRVTLSIALTMMLCGCTARSTALGEESPGGLGDGSGGEGTAGSRQCTANLFFPVTGDVLDQTGAKITPDSVSFSVGNFRDKCTLDFPGVSYACPEEGPGIYEVSVTVRGNTQTKRSSTLESDGCHVRGGAKLDFTFDVEPSDAAPLEDVLHQRGDGALDASSGCTCANESPGVYRTSLDCFCQAQPANCPRAYDPTQLKGMCDPPIGGFVMAYASVEVTNYPSCNLVGVRYSARDSPNQTWFFDAITHQLVGLTYQPWQRRMVDACHENLNLSQVLAGIAPTCPGDVVGDLCDRDAGDAH